jgi:Ca2+-binding RTX toxin-like protein
LFGTAGSVITLASFENIERVEAAATGTLRLLGTTVNDMLDFSNTELIRVASIDGGAGADTIIGSAGADTIIGGRAMTL